MTSRPSSTPSSSGGALADGAAPRRHRCRLRRGATARPPSAGRGLRLTLSLAAAPPLLSVPWEFLYRRPRFLANQRQTPLVRHLDDRRPSRRRRPSTSVVRILGVVASPNDCNPLDVDGERRRVEQAMAEMIAARPGRSSTGSSRPTPRALRQRAARRQLPRPPLRRPQRLHGRRRGRAVPRGRRRPAEVDGTELANLLADQTRCASSCSTRARAPAPR